MSISYSSNSKHIVDILTFFTIRPSSIYRFLAYREEFFSKELFTLSTSLMSTCSNSFKLMSGAMLGLTYNFKVAYSIIKFISILMMNNLIWKWKKFSSQVFFHYMSMFANQFSIHVDNSITAGNCSILFIPRNTAIFSPYLKSVIDKFTLFGKAKFKPVLFSKFSFSFNHMAIISGGT